MIVAGIGLRKAATIESLKSALELADADFVDAIATPADKTDHPALVALITELGIKLVGVSQAELQSQETQTNSARVMEKRGTGSVAEAAALAVAGPSGVLKTVRVVSQDRMATCAIALGD